MKKFTLAAAIAAASITFAAAPAFAETAVSDSQQRVDRALGTQDVTPKAQTRATTFSQRDAKPLDRYQRAQERLFKFRFGPSDR